jgi:hypothetical protein
MCEQLRDLLPPPLGLDPCEVEGLGDGLTRHGQLQGQAPRVERRLHPWLVGVLRTSLQIVGVGEEGGKAAQNMQVLRSRLPRNGMELSPPHPGSSSFLVNTR